jgi:membrane-bound lytic murein transglycosylase F
VRLAVVIGCLLSTTAVFAADLPEIKQRGTLKVVAVSWNSPLPGRSPFLAVEGDRIVGFDADVLAGFAHVQGLKLAAVTIPSWDALMPALLEGKGDLIAGNVTATEARRKLIDFTTEVLPTRIVVLTRRPHARITTREQLQAEKVAAARGTSPYDALLSAGVPRQNVDDSLPPQKVIDALQQGRLGAVAVDVQAAVEAQRRDGSLELGMFLGPPESLAYGLSKDSPILLKALNAHIEGLKGGPSWYRLLVQYFGSSAPEILKRVRTDS